MGCVYSGSAHPNWRGPDTSQPFSLRQNQGRLSPLSVLAACQQNPVGRWSVVEWPGSKPVMSRAGFLGQKRQCSPESGCPQQRNPSGGERRWGREGVVEGTGKVVEEAHGVSAELWAVLGGRRGTGVAAHGGSATVSKAWFRSSEVGGGGRKEGLHGGVPLL
jgi:hypothetical protein